MSYMLRKNPEQTEKSREYNKKHGWRSRSKPNTGREIIETVDEMNVDSENLGMGDNVSRDSSPNKIAESLVDRLPETNDPVMRMLIEMSRKPDEIGRKQDEIHEEVAKIGQRRGGVQTAGRND
ncbi:hypothetical protein J6590_078271 [Homalodisca vitripennis]|nr:hypothetical protein J6590_078271 [Homalodisca vitripennis]